MTDEYLKVSLDKAIEYGGQGKNQLYNKTIPAFLKSMARNGMLKFMMIISTHDANTPETDYQLQ